ncbi:MAG TPA: SPOR domain-containing protein [Gallionella sp.]|nr:SPOR domain-containing protein [Gallionella sp.]
MAKELTDDELNLRRKARRRLIGASALTLAVVVILPMVLDSEPKPSTQDIDLRIPNPDKVGEFVPGVAVSEVAGMLPLAASAVAPASAVAAVSAPAAVSAVAASPVAAVETVKPVVNEIKGNVSKQAQPVAEVAEPKTEVKSESKQGGAGYAAQVGAYSNAATAKQELDKLKKWGFKAYTEKTGNKIRVRVGPYDDRDKAVKVVKLLEKHGLHPSIVSAK